MLNVLWEIIIPLLLASLIGLFIGWLLWRWRRARVTKVEWNQAQQRIADAERSAAELASTNSELDARAITLDVELESVRRHLNRVRSEHEDMTVRLDSTQSSLSASTVRVEQLEDALSKARSQLKAFASMPSLITARSGSRPRARSRPRSSERPHRRPGVRTRHNASGRLTELESELGTANDLVEEIEGELSGLRDESQDSASMPAGLETARRRADQLEADIQAVNQRVVQMGADLALARDRVGDLDCDLVQAKSELHTIAPTPDRLDGEPSRHLEIDAEFADALARLGQVQDDLADTEPTAPSFEWQRAEERSTGRRDWQHGITVLGTPGARHTDDLKVISGIGTKTEIALSQLGIRTWEQISVLEETDIELVAQAIDSFVDRIERDAWVEQAQDLIERFPHRDQRPTKETLINSDS